MIFSSYTFIFIFFPIVLFGYYIICRIQKTVAPKLWLIAASLCFYAQGNLKFIPILLFTILSNFLIAHGIQHTRKYKWIAMPLLLIGLFIDLGILFYYKYCNFFLENVNQVMGTEYFLENIVLPLGISFYTFQLVTYLTDCYRGEARIAGFVDYMVFVTFFPQLIVGPIVRHDEIFPQLRYPQRLFYLKQENIMKAMLLFSIGCAKKILLADPLILHAQDFYLNMGSGNFFESWGGVLAYTFAYYFDFSGYADMAVGLGLFFNIELPFNFNSPYKARNFADFWRRWNITVSNFLNDYVFKNIFHFGDGVIKLVLATMITFLASGIWHGAGWHFIFWGLANGVLVVMANLMTLKQKELPFFIAWFLTFFTMVLTRVLFDSNDMQQAVQVYKGLFDLRLLFQNAEDFWQLGADYLSANWSVLLLLILCAFISFFFKNAQEWTDSFTPKWYMPAYCALLLVLSLFYMGKVSTFLYFQF